MAKLRFLRSNRRSPAISRATSAPMLRAPWRSTEVLAWRNREDRIRHRGSVGLAKAGKIDSATADLDIQMHNVPNALPQREAPLGWVLMPLVGAEDYAQMFGPHLNELKTRLKIDDGKMVLEDFRAQGQTQNKRPTLLAGR